MFEKLLTVLNKPCYTLIITSKKESEDMEVDSIARARQHLDNAETALRGLNRVIEDMEETVRKMEELRNSLKARGAIR